MQAQVKNRLQLQVALALVCSMAYFYTFQLNWYWFNSFEFSYGVNLVYIPSGVRFLFVLVLLETAVVGIAAASLFINYTLGSPDAHVFNIVTAMISAAAPYLARQIAVHFFKLSPQLSNLRSADFFKLSVLFACISATMHQVWYVWQGVTDNWLHSTLAMGLGDWLGTVLVLAFASLMIKGYRFMVGNSSKH